MKRGLVLALFTALLAALASQSVFAQYPPPVGSVSLSTSSGSANSGEEVVLTCNVIDSSGQPLHGVSCEFFIVSAPGSDASLGPDASPETNSEGIATAVLNVGSTAGTIVVRVRAGELESLVIVEVKGVVVLPPSAPINITPPSTGDAGLR